MPYGETRYSWGVTPTDRRFTGQREESGLGSLYDYGARRYSPVLARFISADTIVPSPGNPQSLNRYSYVLNSPLKYTDPTGHMEACPDNNCAGTGIPPESWQRLPEKYKRVALEAYINYRENPELYIAIYSETPYELKGLEVYAQYMHNQTLDQFLGVDSFRIFSARLEKAQAQMTSGEIDRWEYLKKATVPIFAIGTMLAAEEATGGKINITRPGLKHVLDRHTVNGTQTAGKSIFLEGEDIVGLIRQAEGVRPVRQANGNYARTVDAGRVIGTDRATGQLTTQYTVITNSSDTLVTAFPGVP